MDICGRLSHSVTKDLQQLDFRCDFFRRVLISVLWPGLNAVRKQG